MKKSKWIFIAAMIIGAVITGAILLSRSGGPTADAIEVDWRLLGDLDYISGKPTGELKNMDGKFVKIPGFMVPLEDNMKKVSEFLLVPSPQACIHVPPPPPNQMVYIKMDVSANTQVAYGPIWVYGTLSITSVRHMYGEASFQMTGMTIEPYK